MLHQHDERGRVKDWWLDPFEKFVLPKRGGEEEEEEEEEAEEEEERGTGDGEEGNREEITARV